MNAATVIQMQTRTVRVTIVNDDGTKTVVEETMVSFDGITWRKDQDAERKRFLRARNLHGEKWQETKQKELNARSNPGKKEAPVHLPVKHHGKTLPVSEKGKKHKYKRNLRRKKELKVVQDLPEGRTNTKPAHRHRCHGRTFLCCCDHPHFKKRCGGKYCMFALFAEMSATMAAMEPERRHGVMEDVVAAKGDFTTL